MYPLFRIFLTVPLLLLPVFQAHALSPGPFESVEMIWQHGGNPVYPLQPPLAWELSFKPKISVAADLDGDGDSDLTITTPEVPPLYFENIGTSDTPRFVQRKGAYNPWNGVDISYEVPPTYLPGTFPIVITQMRWDSIPAPLDLDNDGDLDFVLGGGGKIIYVENVGTSTAPRLVRRYGVDNPWNEVEKYGDLYPPLLPPEPLDLDGDGDLDLLVGRGYPPYQAKEESLLYFENIGTPSEPLFIEHQGEDNPVNGITFSISSYPVSLDVDNDGDLDLVIGNKSGSSTGKFAYFENIGSSSNPLFIERFGTENLWNDLEISTSQLLAFSLLDLDADADMDLLVSNYQSGLMYFENIGVPGIPRFAQQLGTDNIFSGFSNINGINSKPNVLDLDDDGDPDFILANKDGSISYFENTGEPSKALFVQRYGTDNPFNAIHLVTASGASEPAPVTLDLDDDGDFDLAIGNFPGSLAYFENIGSQTSPLFMERIGTDNPLASVDVTYMDEYYIHGVTAKPLPLDADNDGDLDFIVISSNNPRQTLFYFENIGNAAVPNFIARNGTDNPLNNVELDLQDLSTWDFDSDGDLDLSYIKNLGSSTTPVYTLYGHGTSTFSGASLDLDSDGDLDLLVTNDYGYIVFFENKNLEDYERVFNWAESILPDLFPLPAENLDLPPFEVRFYPTTGIYLGYNTSDCHAYFFAPPYTELVDLGLLETYFEPTLAAGF